MLGRPPRDIARLEGSVQRFEDKVERLRQDTNGMGSRLDQRIDLLAGLVQEAQSQAGKDHERVMHRLDGFNEEMADRVDLIDAAVKDLTVKVGIEVGRIRTAADQIADRKRVRAEILSGDFVKRYRLLVIVVVGVVLLALGGALAPLIEKLFSAVL